MKQFFVFVLLAVAVFSYQAVASTVVEGDYSTMSMEGEPYVIVYYQNGGVFVIIVDEPVNCQDLADFVDDYMVNTRILDCGPLNSITIPKDATTVTEEQALNDLGQSEWP